MSAVKEAINNELLARYVGGEIIVQNNTDVLTRGTITGLEVKGEQISALFKDTSWKKGSLDNLDAGKWSDTTYSSTAVLLSMNIESANGDVLRLGASPSGTASQLTPRVR